MTVWEVNLNVPNLGPVTGTVTIPESDFNPAEAVQEWLRNIDPEELDRAALAEMGGLGGMNAGEAYLLVLRRWAGEQQ